jgi:thioredoxin 1
MSTNPLHDVVVEKMEKVVENLFSARSKAKKASVVAFGAVWCGNCKTYQPKLRGFVSETDIPAYYVDADRCSELADKLEVDLLPTTLVVKQGKVVGRVEGNDLEKLGGILKKLREEEAKEAEVD